MKWYEKRARLFPQIHWEFIGCPESIQQDLMKACRGRTSFYPASWEARERLWNWDMMVYHNPDVTESFGRTVAESMRAACIPVVDNRGGFREQIVPGTGYLCESEQFFDQAIKELLSNETRKDRALRCLEHSDKQFSLKRFGEDLLKQFQAACEVSV